MQQCEEFRILSLFQTWMWRKSYTLFRRLEKKVNKTVEHLHDFDTKVVRTLDTLDKGINTMVRFVGQMESMASDGSPDITAYNPKQFIKTGAYRSLEGELIHKVGMKPAQRVSGKDFDRYLSAKFHIYKDGSIVMEYRKPGSKHL